MTDGGRSCLTKEPRDWRRAALNIVLGNAFFLGICLLFDIASSRSLVTTLTVGYSDNTDTWGLSSVTSLVTGLCVLGSMAFLGNTHMNDTQFTTLTNSLHNSRQSEGNQECQEHFESQQSSTKLTVKSTNFQPQVRSVKEMNLDFDRPNGFSSNCVNKTKTHTLVSSITSVKEIDLNFNKNQDPKPVQTQIARETGEQAIAKDDSEMDGVVTEPNLTSVPFSSCPQTDQNSRKTIQDNENTVDTAEEIIDFEKVDVRRAESPLQVPTDYTVDSSSQTSEELSEQATPPKPPCEPRASMTEEVDTEDAAAGADVTDRAVMTTGCGPFKKKLRRAQRAIKDAKSKWVIEKKVKITPWRQRLNRYNDKITALHRLLGQKDAMAGVTCAARRDSEAEVRGLTRALRSSKDKLQHQVRLNRQLETDIAERSYTPISERSFAPNLDRSYPPHADRSYAFNADRSYAANVEHSYVPMVAFAN